MKILSAILLSLASSITNNACAQTSCTSIDKSDPKSINFVIAQGIRKAGSYCLFENIVSPRVFDLHGERYHPATPVLRIWVSNVKVDLLGKSIIAEAGGMLGISLDLTDESNRLPSNVVLRNGTVSAHTNSAIRLAFREGSLLSDFMILYSGNSDMAQGALDKVQRTTAEIYPLTKNVIENLKVEANTNRKTSGAGLYAVGMTGNGNVIRNSTIRIKNGHAAAYLFGPNNVIENNVIIFEGKSAFESSAAIKLHHADGTVIRNNDIIVDAPLFEDPVPAIALIDSKNVLIENNRYYGVKAVIKKWDEQSSTEERGNEVKKKRDAPRTDGAPGTKRPSASSSPHADS